MIVELSPEAWAQVRHEYEHTDKPVHDICAEHGISPGTLRDRMRRWRWTRRRPPIAAEGPPATQPIEEAVPLAPALADEALTPQAAPREVIPPDPAVIVPRLQGAIARVLPAIEATVATLAAGSMGPREMERAGRTLSSLTRTLRELNGLLSQYPVPPDRGPEDDNEFVLELVRRMDAFAARHAAQSADGDQ